MNRSVFSIIFLALVAHLCVAEIFMQTSEPEHLTHLYDAAIDILMTCYGDPGHAIGIVSDSDGAFLKALRLKYFIPVVLTNRMLERRVPDSLTQHELQVFVVAAASQVEAVYSMDKLRLSKWWNQYAKVLFIDATPNYYRQCAHIAEYLYLPFHYGVLDTQLICYHRSSGILMWNSNIFTSQAPPVWELVALVKFPGIRSRMRIFRRMYRKGGQACEALNFPKTINIGGWPLHYFVLESPIFYNINDSEIQKDFNSKSDNMRRFTNAYKRHEIWIMDNIDRSLNATRVIDASKNRFYDGSQTFITGVYSEPYMLSAQAAYTKNMTSLMIFPMSDTPLFGVTTYTDHMSQLDKILSVIDRTSRIGMWLVYLITLLFFKFFLSQAVVPAVLNLVRLTCNTGLPKLPQNLAPRIYLTCLFIFVVTLQGIYTGNLATLLTTTIAYRNVETKSDIPNLGYTLCIHNDTNAKLAGDPQLDGHVIELPNAEKCIDYVLTGKAVYVASEIDSIQLAIEYNFHISKDPIVRENIYYIVSLCNPLGRRIETILRRLGEHGFRFKNRDLENLRLLYLHDDEVTTNSERRVMTLTDLCFAFVILGIGLSCSLISFIGEIAIYKIRLKIAKRRKRVRARLAWHVEKNYFLSFPSFNFRFNVRRLFSKRR